MHSQPDAPFESEHHHLYLRAWRRRGKRSPQQLQSPVRIYIDPHLFSASFLHLPSRLQIQLACSFRPLGRLLGRSSLIADPGALQDRFKTQSSTHQQLKTVATRPLVRLPVKVIKFALTLSQRIPLSLSPVPGDYRYSVRRCSSSTITSTPTRTH